METGERPPSGRTKLSLGLDKARAQVGLPLRRSSGGTEWVNVGLGWVHSNKKLLLTKCIATSTKKLLVAKGIITSNNKLLATVTGQVTGLMKGG